MERKMIEPNASDAINRNRLDRNLINSGTVGQEPEYCELFDNMPTTFLQQLSADDADAGIPYDGGGFIHGESVKLSRGPSVVVKEETVSQDGLDLERSLTLSEEPLSIHEALANSMKVPADPGVGQPLGSARDVKYLSGNPGSLFAIRKELLKAPSLENEVNAGGFSGFTFTPNGANRALGTLGDRSGPGASKVCEDQLDATPLPGERGGATKRLSGKIPAGNAKALKKSKEPSLNIAFPSRVGQYELKILKQPEEQHRARYLTEGSRGTVKDVTQQGHPTVQLLGYNQPGLVLQVFVGADMGKVKAHGFYQAVKVSNKNSTPCTEKDIEGTTVIEIELSPEQDMTATIDCVGILKLRNADVEQRIGLAKSKKKSTYARLVFRVNIPKLDGGYITLQSASNPILCTQPTGAPEISKRSISRCSVKGQQELFIIGKNFMKGTQVFFEQIHNDQVVWSQEADIDQDFFQATHIVCKIPAYCNMDIKEEVEVQVVVHSSGRISEPATFFYEPYKSSVPMEIDSSRAALLESHAMANHDSAQTGTKRTYAERATGSPEISTTVMPDSSSPAQPVEFIQVTNSPVVDIGSGFILTHHRMPGFVAAPLDVTPATLSHAATLRAVEEGGDNKTVCVTPVSLLISSSDIGIKFPTNTSSDYIKDDEVGNIATLVTQVGQKEVPAVSIIPNNKTWIAANTLTLADSVVQDSGTSGDINNTGMGTIVFQGLNDPGTADVLQASRLSVQPLGMDQPLGMQQNMYQSVAIIAPSDLISATSLSHTVDEIVNAAEDFSGNATEPIKKRRASIPDGEERLNILMQMIQDGSTESQSKEEALDMLRDGLNSANSVNMQAACSNDPNMSQKFTANNIDLSVGLNQYVALQHIDSNQSVYASGLDSNPLTASEFSLSPPGSSLDVLQQINDPMLFSFTSELLPEQFPSPDLSSKPAAFVGDVFSSTIEQMNTDAHIVKRSNTMPQQEFLHHDSSASTKRLPTRNSGSMLYERNSASSSHAGNIIDSLETQKFKNNFVSPQSSALSKSITARMVSSGNLAAALGGSNDKLYVSDFSTHVEQENKTTSGNTSFNDDIARSDVLIHKPPSIDAIDNSSHLMQEFSAGSDLNSVILVKSEEADYMGSNLQQSLSELEVLRSQVSSAPVNQDPLAQYVTPSDGLMTSYHNTDPITALDSNVQAAACAIEATQGVSDMVGMSSALDGTPRSNILQGFSEAGDWKAVSGDVRAESRGSSVQSMAWSSEGEEGSRCGQMDVGGPRLTIEQLATELNKMNRESQLQILGRLLPELKLQGLESSQLSFVGQTNNSGTTTTSSVPMNRRQGARGQGQGYETDHGDSGDRKSDLAALLSSNQPHPREALVNLLQQQILDKQNRQLLKQQQQQQQSEADNKQLLQQLQTTQLNQLIMYQQQNVLNSQQQQGLMTNHHSQAQQPGSSQLLMSHNQELHAQQNEKQFRQQQQLIELLQKKDMIQGSSDQMMTHQGSNTILTVSVDSNSTLFGHKPMDCSSSNKMDAILPMDVTPYQQFYSGSTVGVSGSNPGSVAHNSSSSYKVNPSSANHSISQFGYTRDSTLSVSELMHQGDSQGKLSQDVLSFLTQPEASTIKSDHQREPAFIEASSDTSSTIQSTFMHVVTSADTSLPYLNADDISRCLNNMADSNSH